MIRKEVEEPGLDQLCLTTSYTWLWNTRNAAGLNQDVWEVYNTHGISNAWWEKHWKIFH